VRPARSNSGLGIEAQISTAKNPYFCSHITNFAFKRELHELPYTYSSDTSSPANLAALATKKGGNSPKAVPKPQRKLSN